MNKLFLNPLFPAGLSVLVVDDDATCLRILEALLLACHYRVVKCGRAVDALGILQERKDEIDIVLSELHLSAMNGFQLLQEIIRLQIDLPVVMMSSDERVDVIKKVVIQGACGYLLKPVRKEEIKLIWQHVVRQKQGNGRLEAFFNSGEIMPQQKIGNAENCGSSNNNGEKKLQNAREAKTKPNNNRDDDTSITANVKKPRMVWTPQLHQQFVAVVNQIGLKNAAPKRILDLMNVPHLTRENVASHLQKYRIHLQRNEDQNSQKKLSIHYEEDINNYAAVLPQEVMTAAMFHPAGGYNYDNFRPHSRCTSSSESSMFRQFEQEDHDPPNSQYNGEGDFGASFYVPSGTDSN